MSFTTNLVRARSHLIIVFGLITASALIMTIETRAPGRLATGMQTKLTPAERRAAAYAWAHIPPAQRTARLRQLAARLHLKDDPDAAMGPEEAVAVLNALTVPEREIR